MYRRHTIGWIFSLLAALWFCYSAISKLPEDTDNLRKGAESRNWPMATARILTNSVETHVSRGRYSTTYRYKCNLSYEYGIGKKRFVCERISFATGADHFLTDRQTVNAIAGEYSLGSKHLVHYNPQNHGEAVLIAGVDPENSGINWYHAGVTSWLLLCIAFGLANSQSETFREGVGGQYVWFLLAAIAVPAYFMEPTVVRNMVPPNAVIQTIAPR